MNCARFRERGPSEIPVPTFHTAWVINGKRCEYRYGVFGDMGAIGQKLERYFTPGAVTYEEGCRLSPGGTDAHECIKVLDAEGIDKVLLYPSLGITWEQGCDDADIATA